MTNKQDREAEGLLKAAYIEGLVAGVSKGSVNAVIADDAWRASRAFEQSTQPPASEGLDVNELSVRITEHAIMELDADEENTAQIEAFGNAVENELRAALQAQPAADLEELIEKFATTRLGDTSGRLIEDVLDRSEIRAALLSTAVISGDK